MDLRQCTDPRPYPVRMVTQVRTRRAVTALSVVYLLAVARMTLMPDLADEDTMGLVRTVVAWLSGQSLPITYDGTEAVANVIMFVPFGVLGCLLVPRHRWWALVAAACATSAGIETAQRLFLPSRVPTLQDVVMNSTGAVLGVTAVTFLVVRHARAHAGTTSGAAAPDANTGRGPDDARAPRAVVTGGTRVRS